MSVIRRAVFRRNLRAEHKTLLVTGRVIARPSAAAIIITDDDGRRFAVSELCD